MKKYLFAELSFAFLFVMAAIWLLPKHVAIAIGIVLVPLLFLFSWCIRPEEHHMPFLEYLGIQPQDFSQAKAMFLCSAVGLCAMAMLAFVLCPDFAKRPDFAEKFFNQFRGYILWAFAQQMLLLGYFANRLEGLLKDKRRAAVAAGLLFAIAHIPNPVLMPVTAFFGGAGVWFFLKSRNAYLATLFHALLGTAVKYLLANPLLDHGMRVGPGFWR